MKNLTSLDYAILGILRMNSLTGYEIRKIIDQKTFGNFSSSPGSIYPALKRLQQLELIYQIVRPKFTTSSKKVFCIQSNGIMKLEEWLKKPIHSDDLDKDLQEIILRFAFMNYLRNTDHTIQFLESFIIEINSYLKKLQEDLKMKYFDLSVNRKLVIENRIDISKTHLQWAQKALKSINESNSKPKS